MNLNSQRELRAKLSYSILSQNFGHFLPFREVFFRSSKYPVLGLSMNLCCLATDNILNETSELFLRMKLSYSATYKHSSSSQLQKK